MKKFNAEKIIFDKFTGFWSAHCRGYTVNLACSQFLVWIVSPSFLQVTMTTIKSLMRSSFGQIQPWTVELAALDRLKKSFYLRTILMTCWLSGERYLPFGLLVKTVS